MLEDKGELAKNSSDELQSSSDTPPHRDTALSRVEERLSKATTPQGVVLWTQVREQIIRQNEIVSVVNTAKAVMESLETESEKTYEKPEK